MRLPGLLKSPAVATLLCFVALAGLHLFASENVSAQEPTGKPQFYLRDGDRVVFYGDSITQQGFYTSYLEDYVVTRFPGWNVTFINAGWSGDWVVGGGGGKAEVRVRRDVLAHHPTVVTVLVGTNDAAYQKFDQAFFDVYTKGYEELLRGLQSSAPAPRITLLQPTAYDDVTRPEQFEGGYNAVLVRYGQFVQQFAAQHQLQSVDLNAPMLAALRAAKESNAALAEKIIPDRIHPSPAGGMLLAAAIVRDWNGPGFVTSVAIDARAGKILSSINTAITGFQSKPGLDWTQQDAALPLPLDFSDAVTPLLLKSSDLIQSIDRQMFVAKNLAPGKYILRIDGEKIGEWPDTELAGGINLALLPTPMLKQALQVHALTRRLLNLRLARWQGVQVGLEEETSPHIADSLKELDALQQELIEQRHKAAQPVPHRYRLEPDANESMVKKP